MTKRVSICISFTSKKYDGCPVTKNESLYLYLVGLLSRNSGIKLHGYAYLAPCGHTYGYENSIYQEANDNAIHNSLICEKRKTKNLISFTRSSNKHMVVTSGLALQAGLHAYDPVNKDLNTKTLPFSSTTRRQWQLDCNYHAYTCQDH